MNLQDELSMRVYDNFELTYTGDVNTRTLKIEVINKDGIKQVDNTVKANVLYTRFDSDGEEKGTIKETYTQDKDGLYNVLIPKEMFEISGKLRVSVQLFKDSQFIGLGIRLYDVERSGFTDKYTVLTPSESSDYADKSYVNTEIKKSADGITADFTKAMGNIKIGGRNYLLDSKTPSWGDNGGIYGASIKESTIGYRRYRAKGDGTNKGISLYQLVSSNFRDISVLQNVFTASVNIKTDTPGKTISLSGVITYQDNTKVYLTATTTTTTTWQRVYITTTPDKHLKEVKGFNLTVTTSDDMTADWLYINEGQVETGNRATDWTPAPEDTDKQISDAKTLATTAQQDLTAFKSTVAQTYETVVGASGKYSTKSELSTLQQDLTGFKTTVSNTYTTKTDFNSLAVGGRNLIIRSAETPKTYMGNGTLTTSEVDATSDYIAVKPGETLTFTKKTTSTNDLYNYFRYAWFDENKGYLSRAVSTNNLIQWKVPDNAYFLRVSYPTDSYPKVERGNIATDWSPAPEDTAKSISEAKTIATTAQQTVDSFTQKIQDLENRLKTLEGK